MKAAFRYSKSGGNPRAETRTGRLWNPVRCFKCCVSRFGFQISSTATISFASTAVLTAVLAGCAVGPNYQRPALDTPDAYRTAASDTSQSGTNSFAGLGWWDAYEDPQLKTYIGEALTNSWDIKIAAARVMQAEAQAGVARSQFFPNAYAGGDVVNSRTSGEGPNSAAGGREVGYGDAFVFAPSYEVDLWGKIRRANEAARARLFATVDAQNTVRQTLVAAVATTYLQLLELDLELEIGRASLVSRTNSLELTSSRQEGGVASIADVYQSKILVSQAEASIVNTLRRIEQTENQLNLLLGRNPGPIQRGMPLADQTLRTGLLAGLPSSLLENRPDIRAAEQLLVAANADVGQAKAAFFPQVTLTGMFGYQSSAMSEMFQNSARMWQFGPAVSMPLFTGGRLKAEYKFAKARFDESVATYQRTVQGAFREVSDALIGYQRNQEYFAKQQDLTQANRDATALANVRYEGGVTGYLEVLYNEQQLFDSEFLLARARRDEFLSVVELYRALGGGWTSPMVAEAKE